MLSRLVQFRSQPNVVCEGCGCLCLCCVCVLGTPLLLLSPSLRYGVHSLTSLTARWKKVRKRQRSGSEKGSEIHLGFLSGAGPREPAAFVEGICVEYGYLIMIARSFR